MEYLDDIQKKMRRSLARLKEQSQRWYEQKEEVWGLPTGIASLDSLTGGQHAEELVTIAAGTGGGKTAFLTQILEHSAQQLEGNRVNILFSLEMSARSLYLRSGARRAGLDSKEVRRGNLKPHEKRAFDQALDELIALPLLIVDDPGLNSQDIVNLMQFLDGEGVKPAIVGVDYVQKLTDEGMPSHPALTAAMRRLAQIRNDYECNVVVLSQYARQYLRDQKNFQGVPQDRPPELWDLKESGSIENDSEQVWLFHTPVPSELYDWSQPYRTRQRRLYIRKNRNGPLCEEGLPLWYVEPLTTFADSDGMVSLENRLSNHIEETYEPDDNDPYAPPF